MMILQEIENAIIRILETKNGLRRSKREDSDNPGLLLGLAQLVHAHERWEKIFLPGQDRLKHIYVLGATGSGKTKLIESFIRQDLLAGRGFGLVDPHGDLSGNILKFLASLVIDQNALSLLEYIGEKLVLIEPFNSQGAVGYNPLEPTGTSAFSLAAELMGVFKRIWQGAHWGPRMEELLRNTLITLSENGLTLLEAPRLLTDSSFRERLIPKLSLEAVRDYWTFRYDPLSEGMKGLFREPTLNRLSVFTTDTAIRLMIGQSRSTIDLRRIMDEGKWLIISLAKGHLAENIHLLGSLLIAKLKLAAMSRVDIQEEERRLFSLYVDEFQNFIGEDFETILSEARKYGLGLVLAHQNLDQVDYKLRAAILGNVATQIFFRLSHHDAAQVSSEMGQKERPLIERRLVDFKVGEAYLKTKGEKPRALHTTHVSEAKGGPQIIQLIRDLSFANFARSRREVENEIEKRRAMFSSGPQTLRSNLTKVKPRLRTPNLGESREGFNDW